MIVTVRVLLLVHRSSHRSLLIVKLELGSTPAVCFAMALQQPCGKNIQLETLDRVAHRVGNVKVTVVDKLKQRERAAWKMTSCSNSMLQAAFAQAFRTTLFSFFIRPSV